MSGCPLARCFPSARSGHFGARRPGRGGSPPGVFIVPRGCYGKAWRPQGEGSSEGVVQVLWRAERVAGQQCHPGGTPRPLPPRNPPRVPCGLLEPGIPFSPALRAVRWRKWKITALARGLGRAGKLAAVVPGVCAAREDESASPNPGESPQGPGAPSQSLGAGAGARGVAVRMGVMSSGFPGATRESSLPWTNFLMAQGA